METSILKELVKERQQKCDTGHICIDTIQGKAKGYGKAKDFHSDNSNNNKTETTELNYSPQSQKVSTKPSEALKLILKSLGVSYID